MKKDDDNLRGKGLVFAGLGMEIVGMMIGSLVVGKVIDDYMGWKGYSVLFLILASFILWVWHIVVISKKFMQDVGNDGTS